jgi:hypothetical protein
MYGLLQSGLLILLGKVMPFEGVVVSVAAGTFEREATVQLNQGPIVRASIPSACLVLPGQIATVNFTGPLIGPGPAFRVWESR